MAAIIAVLGKEKPVAPTMTLPVDALSQDGAEPEKGDEIEHSIRGTIASIKGDMATIKLTALDGKPIEGSPEEEQSESPEEEQSEEEEEGSENPGPSNPGPVRGRRAGAPINIPGLPPAAVARNPLAAPIGARAKARAATQALGTSLRRRAKGMPLPLL
jgi:hypothetical protein